MKYNFILLQSQLLSYRIQLEEHNRLDQENLRKQYEKGLSDLENSIGEELKKAKYYKI